MFGIIFESFFSYFIKVFIVIVIIRLIKSLFTSSKESNPKSNISSDKQSSGHTEINDCQPLKEDKKSITVSEIANTSKKEISIITNEIIENISEKGDYTSKDEQTSLISNNTKQESKFDNTNILSKKKNKQNKKKSYKITFLIVVVGFLSALGFTGYYMYCNRQQVGEELYYQGDVDDQDVSFHNNIECEFIGRGKSVSRIPIKEFMNVYEGEKHFCPKCFNKKAIEQYNTIIKDIKDKTAKEEHAKALKAVPLVNEIAAQLPLEIEPGVKVASCKQSGCLVSYTVRVKRKPSKYKIFMLSEELYYNYPIEKIKERTIPKVEHIGIGVRFEFYDEKGRYVGFLSSEF